MTLVTMATVNVVGRQHPTLQLLTHTHAHTQTVRAEYTVNGRRKLAFGNDSFQSAGSIRPLFVGFSEFIE